MKRHAHPSPPPGHPDSHTSNAAYYDAFSSTYDGERAKPYHRLIDRLALELLAPIVRGRTALEIGAGTGLLLSAVKEIARVAAGLDISRAMLSHARRRGLTTVQGSASALPFPAGCWDVAYCFKTFAHLPDPASALAEMARVVRPGGHVVVELYNPASIRGVLRRFGPVHRIAPSLAEDDVLTRYDTLATFSSWLPPTLTVRRVRGIRVVTPAGRLLSVPLLGSGLAGLERLATALPGTWRAAGFMVVIMERTKGHGQKRSAAS